MGAMTIERLRAVTECAENQSVSEASRQFNLSMETVTRYMREYHRINRMIDQVEPSLPKIIVMDIETTPMESWHFSTGQQYVGINQLRRNWTILSYAYTHLGSGQINGSIMTADEIGSGDEKRLLFEIWKTLDDADYVIGHNFKRFDDRKIRAKFFEFDMLPPSPYRIIDTYLGSKNLGLSSHKLDFLAKLILHKQKIMTDFSLWTGCLNGDQASLDKMYEYNMVDVELNEGVYLKLRPYLKNQPSISIASNLDNPTCGACGSEDVRLIPQTTKTNVSEFLTYRCLKCGTLSRSRYNEIDRKHRRNILTTI